jgi:myo-inositol-1(or 4)-monophosphatase
MLDAAVAAARRAAHVLADWRPRFSVREKGRADLVTEADIAAQAAIRDELLGRFPGHGFLGEEGPAGRRPGPGDPPTWIVDPIDGTTNYVHDVPLYGISIALMVGGELVLGVVYEPCRDEMYTAERGRGAYLNSRPIRVSDTDAVGQALLTAGFATTLAGKEQQLDWWRHFYSVARGLRRTGSTAVNLAYLAAGRFDGFWALDLKPWDSAGGAVIVREAGGRITNFAGDAFDPFRGDLLATNGRLHESMRPVFHPS